MVGDKHSDDVHKEETRDETIARKILETAEKSGVSLTPELFADAKNKWEEFIVKQPHVEEKLRAEGKSRGVGPGK